MTALLLWLYLQPAPGLNIALRFLVPPTQAGGQVLNWIEQGVGLLAFHWLSADQPPPPWPPRPVGMKGGMFIRQSLQRIEHDGHVPRHADLIGLGVVGGRSLQLTR
jgi:hypothetical protein